MSTNNIILQIIQRLYIQNIFTNYDEEKGINTNIMHNNADDIIYGHNIDEHVNHELTEIIVLN